MTEFISRWLYVFNTFYPHDRYIFKTPVTLDSFDNLTLTEIFVGKLEYIVQEYEPVYTNLEDVYVKFLTSGGEEIKIGLLNFDEAVIESFLYKMMEDFTPDFWDLQCEEEEEGEHDELREEFEVQKKLILEKYGNRRIKTW